MIKIVHIARPIGGVGIYIDLLVKHIDEDQFENVIICNQEEEIVEIQNKSNIKVKRFHVNLIREINIFNDAKCLKKIISLLKRISPDIVHCHSAKAGFLGRIAGVYLKIPTVYTPHAYSYLSAETKLKKTIFKTAEKLFRYFPSKTIACSTSEYNRTINDIKIKKKKVHLWNNSIESDIVFQPIEKIDQLPENFICSIGRPSYQKNTKLLIKTILEAKAIIKNIHLIILGVGFYSPSLENVEKLIKSNKLEENITLIPWLNRPETMAILKRSLFYVSTSRYEGLPYAVIEAMALSKPCIVTNVDGNKDLIKDNFNGFLVNEDSKQIVKAMEKLYNDSSLMKRMELNTREEYLNNYNIKNNIKSLENIYFNLF